MCPSIKIWGKVERKMIFRISLSELGFRLDSLPQWYQHLRKCRKIWTTMTIWEIRKEIRRLCSMTRVDIVPLVIGALGSISPYQAKRFKMIDRKDFFSFWYSIFLPPACIMVLLLSDRFNLWTVSGIRD